MRVPRIQGAPAMTRWWVTIRWQAIESGWRRIIWPDIALALPLWVRCGLEDGHGAGGDYLDVSQPVRWKPAFKVGEGAVWPGRPVRPARLAVEETVGSRRAAPDEHAAEQGIRGARQRCSVACS